MKKLLAPAAFALSLAASPLAAQDDAKPKPCYGTKPESNIFCPANPDAAQRIIDYLRGTPLVDRATIRMRPDTKCANLTDWMSQLSEPDSKTNPRKVNIVSPGEIFLNCNVETAESSENSESQQWWERLQEIRDQFTALFNSIDKREFLEVGAVVGASAFLGLSAFRHARNLRKHPPSHPKNRENRHRLTEAARNLRNHPLRHPKNRENRHRFTEAALEKLGEDLDTIAKQIGDALKSVAPRGAKIEVKYDQKNHFFDVETNYKKGDNKKGDNYNKSTQMCFDADSQLIFAEERKRSTNIGIIVATPRDRPVKLPYGGRVTCFVNEKQKTPEITAEQECDITVRGLQSSKILSHESLPSDDDLVDDDGNNTQGDQNDGNTKTSFVEAVKGAIRKRRGRAYGKEDIAMLKELAENTRVSSAVIQPDSEQEPKPSHEQGRGDGDPEPAPVKADDGEKPVSSAVIQPHSEQEPKPSHEQGRGDGDPEPAPVKADDGEKPVSSAVIQPHSEQEPKPSHEQGRGDGDPEPAPVKAGDGNKRRRRSKEKER